MSYAIGVAEPISITLFHYGTSTKTQKELLKIVNSNFDLRPGRIVRFVNFRLGLRYNKWNMMLKLMQIKIHHKMMQIKKTANYYKF